MEFFRCQCELPYVAYGGRSCDLYLRVVRAHQTQHVLFQNSIEMSKNSQAKIPT